MLTALVLELQAVQADRLSDALLEQGALSVACQAIGIAVPHFRLRPVPDQDWVSASRDQFGPVRVSERLWIVPTWHSPPDPAAISLVLDPGLAFGTGSHATTRLCLQWLERT